MKCERCRGTGQEPTSTLMGEQLRKARAHAKRKLKDVANAMGISAPYLSDLERGNRYWSTELISKFKKAIA